MQNLNNIQKDDEINANKSNTNEETKMSEESEEAKLLDVIYNSKKSQEENSTPMSLVIDEATQSSSSYNESDEIFNQGFENIQVFNPKNTQIDENLNITIFSDLSSVPELIFSDTGDSWSEDEIETPFTTTTNSVLVCADNKKGNQVLEKTIHDQSIDLEKTINFNIENITKMDHETSNLENSNLLKSMN